MILKVIGATLGVLIGLAFLFGIFSLALWWLVPLAFPLLGFTFWNALALAGIIALALLPAMSK